jgi:hypothetical protein
MTKIVLDASTRNKLLDLAQPLELCDESGKVLGVFTPVVRPEPTISEEELDRREEETESYSTAEVLAHVEKR